jgi:hypothetical protein
MGQKAKSKIHTLKNGKGEREGKKKRPRERVECMMIDFLGAI